MKIEFTAMTAQEMKLTGRFILDIANIREAADLNVNAGDAVRRPSAEEPEKVTLHPEPEVVTEEKPKRTRKPKEEKQEVAQEQLGEPAENATEASTPGNDAPVEEVVEATAAEPEKSYTMDDVRSALKQYSEKHGMPEAINLLGEFGAARVSEVKPEQFAAFVAKATA